jgi:hypothetical protein
VSIPEGPVPTDSDQPLPFPLRQALDRLFAPAPSHLFPRARQLYFLKYPLEGLPQELDSSPFAARFRTFVLRDTTCLPTGEMEDPRAITRISELAVVHWQAPQTNPEDYATYIRSTWQLEPHDLQLIEQPWFREGGAWARLLLTRPAADRAPAPAAPASTP